MKKTPTKTKDPSEKKPTKEKAAKRKTSERPKKETKPAKPKKETKPKKEKTEKALKTEKVTPDTPKTEKVSHQAKPKIIIQPGSYNLRFGLSTSLEPISVPHCIARRLNIQEETEADVPVGQIRDWARGPTPYDEPLQALEKETLGQFVVSGQARFNASNSTRPVASPGGNEQNLIHTTYRYHEEDDFLVAEDVLKIVPTDPYTIHFPFRYGYINRAGQSVHAIEGNIEALWRTVITQRLRIEPENFVNYPVILVIPDMFQKSDILMLVRILLEKLNFKSVFLQKEAIYSTIAANKTSACVVDFGHTKTTVTCVDEGQVIPGTTFHLSYGGDDITGLLFHLLSSQQVLVENEPTASPEIESPIETETNPEPSPSPAVDPSAPETAPPPATEVVPPTIIFEEEGGEEKMEEDLPPAQPRPKMEIDVPSPPLSVPLPKIEEQEAPIIKNQYGGHHFPMGDCRLDYIRDYAALQQVKESCCHLNKKIVVMNKNIPLFDDHRGTGHVYSFSMSVALAMAPRGIFSPSTVLNPVCFSDYFTGRRRHKRKFEEIGDLQWGAIEADEESTATVRAPFTEGTQLPEDIMNVTFLNSLGLDWVPTSSQKQTYDRSHSSSSFKRRRKSTSSKHDEPALPSEPVVVTEEQQALLEKKTVRLTVPNHLVDQRAPVPIHEAIIEAIEQVNDKDIRKNLFESIIVTGGSSAFVGLKERLEDKLMEILPRDIKSVEITTSRDLLRDPLLFSWQGAQVSHAFISKSDFITKEMWEKRNVIALRENLHFLFDNPDNKK